MVDEKNSRDEGDDDDADNPNAGEIAGKEAEENEVGETLMLEVAKQPI